MSIITINSFTYLSYLNSLSSVHCTGSAGLNKLLREKESTCKEHVNTLLAKAERLTICLDGWSKKGLTSSYLGISVCLFDESCDLPVHVMLNLEKLQNPHTGENLAKCLKESLKKWAVPPEKVFMVVSDSGTNMVKAIKLLQEQAQRDMTNNDEVEGVEDIDENDEVAEGDEIHANETDEEEDEDMDENFLELPDNVPYRRLPCMVHSLQLVVKQGLTHGSLSNIIAKAKGVVSTLRKSTIAMGRLVGECGKTVVADCITRWNSTYFMCKRLLEIKVAVTDALNHIGADGLLASEWSRQEELVNLLEPFAVQTNILQTDTMSLSTVIPSLLELECHLKQGNFDYLFDVHSVNMLYLHTNCY